MGGFATPLVQTLRIRYQPTRALHDSPRTPVLGAGFAQVKEESPLEPPPFLR